MSLKCQQPPATIRTSSNRNPQGQPKRRLFQVWCVSVLLGGGSDAERRAPGLFVEPQTMNNREGLLLSHGCSFPKDTSLPAMRVPTGGLHLCRKAKFHRFGGDKTHLNREFWHRIFV